MSEGRREGRAGGVRDGRAESGGMAAKKLEPHTEMWGIRIEIRIPVPSSSFL